MSTTQNDFTPTGLKLEGAFENDRNRDNSALFKDIIKEVFGVTDVICGHHLSYEARWTGKDGFTYEQIQEIPSADALIFDPDVAEKIFGDDWKNVLTLLAVTPIAQRDALYGEFYYGNRHKKEHDDHV